MNTNYPQSKPRRAMLHIIQSNKIETLFDELLTVYQHPTQGQSVFEPFNVIVPSKVMGEWLKKQVADRAGISTLVTTEFWGRYVWGLMQRVLRIYKRYRDEVLEVPDVAMLSKSIMQWQIFGLLMAHRVQIAKDDTHPLQPFVEPLMGELAGAATDTKDTHSDTLAAGPWQNQSLLANSQVTDNATDQSLEQRLWQLASDMASMLNRYLTYRPQWLEAWGNNQPIDITKLISEKDDLQNRLHGRVGEDALVTPDWLIEHYTQLEAAQRYLWLTLFDADYRYRETLQRQFWQAFSDKDSAVASRCRRQLPKQLILFTVQQLPPSELLDLQRLGELTEVMLLHFNPSEQFWADIVDKNWLIEQQIANPESIYLKDYGHTLLSRFGKQSREVFAMLANLSGNAYQTVLWEDKFVSDEAPASLLANLQQDMLTLEEANTTTKIQDMLNLVSETTLESLDTPGVQQQLTLLQNAGVANNAALSTLLDKLEAEQQRRQRDRRLWQTQQLLDSSLSIQVCHSLVRQLEVLRSMLIGWLNYSDKPDQMPESEFERRSLSDVLVLLPDIEAQQNIIEAIFPKGVGADGYALPAKVTGVIAKDINQLWQAITGYYRLLNRAGARFSRTEVFDWLLLPPLYESFGLSLEQMSRACDLLAEAGFVRGFDEQHLQQSLHTADDDYRYSFAFALERLVAGVLMPKATVVKFGDLVNQHGETEYTTPLDQVTLADAPLVAVLCDIYQTLDGKRYMGKHSATVSEWLQEVEGLIQSKFSVFNQTNAWLAIFAAQNELKNHLAANHKKPSNHTKPPTAQFSQPLSDKAIATDALPLKLNFVLESIAEQLVSQQVSAEPSGVITFARVGAVRNLPFKLVVLLNLNLSDFPSREQHNRYNLMQAGLPVRGDRFREDDDLGAFLDALLCAKEGCWLFYNGKSTTDTHEHLPASPVQELLNFLQTEVQWQAQLANDLDHQEDGQPPDPSAVSFGQQVEQYLVTHHPALPFDKGYFELPSEADNVAATAATTTAKSGNYETQLRIAKSQLYPPAPIWHGLYQQLEQAKQQIVPFDRQIIRVWQKPQLNAWLSAWQQAKHALNAQLMIGDSQAVSLANLAGEQRHIRLEKLIRGLQDPAATFIQAQQLFIPTAQVATLALEPLTLDGLGRYQLNQRLIAEQLTGVNDERKTLGSSLAHADVLPAGVNRYQSLNEQARITRYGLLKFIADLIVLADPAGRNASATKQNLPPNLTRADVLPLAQAIDETFGKLDAKALLVLAAQDIHHPTLNRALGQLGQRLTACQAQHLVVSLPALAAQTQLPDSAQLQHVVITADLPAPLDGPYWLQYLPQSGAPKYQLTCWLSHLAWQVARRTSPGQVAACDGLSLWRYRDVTFYLPPIAWPQAYQYLQDWLAVWQLAEHRVMVMPPNMSLSYLQQQAAAAATDQPLTYKTLDLAAWAKVAYNQDPQPHHYDHAYWQRLLGEQKLGVIWPFLTTIVPMLYQPLHEGLVDVYAVADANGSAAEKVKPSDDKKTNKTTRKPKTAPTDDK